MVWRHGRRNGKLNKIKEVRGIRISILLQFVMVACITVVNWFFAKGEIGRMLVIVLYTSLLIVAIASLLAYAVMFIGSKDKQFSLDFLMLCLLIVITCFNLHVTITLFVNTILSSIRQGFDATHESRVLYNRLYYAVFGLLFVVEEYNRFLYVNYKYDSLVNINTLTKSKVYHFLSKVSRPLVTLHNLGSRHQRIVRCVLFMSVLFIVVVWVSVLNGSYSVPLKLL